MNILDDKLSKLSNDIYVKYTTEGELTGSITILYDSPTPHELLLLKRNLKTRLSKLDTNYYIDDIEFTFGTYSRDKLFHKSREWDGVALMLSFGLLIPFLLPKLVNDLYKYYNTTDYNYIDYRIAKRKSNII
jgi:hypothetical protein